MIRFNLTSPSFASTKGPHRKQFGSGNDVFIPKMESVNIKEVDLTQAQKEYLALLKQFGLVVGTVKGKLAFKLTPCQLSEFNEKGQPKEE